MIKPYYEEKNIKIFLGDSEDLLPILPEDSIDLCVTSPPYLNAEPYSYYESVDAYKSKMRAIFAGVFRVLKQSRMCCVNISCVIEEREKRSEQSRRIPLPFYFVPMMEQIGFEFLEDIIWQKPEGAAKNRNGGFFQHRKPVAYKPNIVTEYILIFKKPAPFLIDKILRNDSLVSDGYERSNVWTICPENNSDHPAPFPIELPLKIIEYYSYQSETILDPFCGSASAGAAAKKMNRSFIGIEKEIQYLEMSRARLAQEVFCFEEAVK